MMQPRLASNSLCFCLHLLTLGLQACALTHSPLVDTIGPVLPVALNFPLHMFLLSHIPLRQLLASYTKTFPRYRIRRWKPSLTLTWVSERFSWRASSVRSRPTTYWQRWNSISRRYSCSAVKEVRVLLGRSRSRPLGRTISRMVPLASARTVKGARLIH